MGNDSPMGDEMFVVQCQTVEIISRRALVLRIRQPFS